jgi:dTDP-4-amino-4,6-dideoxygalactose transaminase
MKVKFLDLAIKDDYLKKKYLSSINNIFKYGKIIDGKKLNEFQKKMSKISGRKYCIGLSSGTDALFLALKALNLKKNDEIITTPLSWISPANAILISGAKPVFADIDEDLNISPESISSLINKKTKAILCVNFTGTVCQMDKILKICKKNRLFLIEDASQSFGATYKNKMSGSFGTISAISHNPMKVLSAYGEAGSILTNNKKIYETIKILKYSGMINKKYCKIPSLNSKMDEIQSAILVENLKKFKEIIKIRNKNARFYNKHLGHIVSCPKMSNSENINIFYAYTIKANERNKLRNFLSKNKIETNIQHPILICDQKPFQKFKKRVTNAKKIVKKILSLPISENLKINQQRFVIKKIKDFYKNEI